MQPAPCAGFERGQRANACRPPQRRVTRHMDQHRAFAAHGLQQLAHAALGVGPRRAVGRAVAHEQVHRVRRCSVEDHFVAVHPRGQLPGTVGIAMVHAQLEPCHSSSRVMAWPMRPVAPRTRARRTALQTLAATSQRFVRGRSQPRPTRHVKPHPASA